MKKEEEREQGEKNDSTAKPKQRQNKNTLSILPINPPKNTKGQLKPRERERETATAARGNLVAPRFLFSWNSFDPTTKTFFVFPRRLGADLRERERERQGSFDQFFPFYFFFRNFGKHTNREKKCNQRTT